MGQVLAVLGGIQLAAGVIKPSIDAGLYSNSINKNIDQIKKETLAIKENYKNLQVDFAKLDVGLQSEIQESLNKISQIHSQILDSQIKIQETKKTIQMFGIIFIVMIFFSLIIKEFDLLKFFKKSNK